MREAKKIRDNFAAAKMEQIERKRYNQEKDN
jgi:hypothetical protein